MVTSAQNPMNSHLVLHRHFKGGLYIVLGVARGTEDNNDYVVYQAIGSAPMYVRPFENFYGEVILPNGNKITRFTVVHN